MTGRAMRSVASRVRHRYFDATTAEVVERLRVSAFPFRPGERGLKVDEDLTETLRMHPDLWGMAIVPVAAVALLLCRLAARGEWSATASLACCAALFTAGIIAAAHVAVTRVAAAAAGNWLQLACLLGGGGDYSILASHVPVGAQLASCAFPAWFPVGDPRVALSARCKLVTLLLPLHRTCTPLLPAICPRCTVG